MKFFKEDFVVDNIKCSAKIQKESCTKFFVFCFLDPEIIELSNSCGSGVVWAETMVVWMPEIVPGEMFCYLVKHCSFC